MCGVCVWGGGGGVLVEWIVMEDRQKLKQNCMHAGNLSITVPQNNATIDCKTAELSRTIDHWCRRS